MVLLEAAKMVLPEAVKKVLSEAEKYNLNLTQLAGNLHPTYHVNFR